MSRWARLKRAAGGRRSRSDGAGEAAGEQAVIGSDESPDDPLADPSAESPGERPPGEPTDAEGAAALPTDAVAEDALLDELSLVFADDELAAEQREVDRPAGTDPPAPATQDEIPAGDIADGRVAGDDPPTTSVEAPDVAPGDLPDIVPDDLPATSAPAAPSIDPARIEPTAVDPAPVAPEHAGAGPTGSAATERPVLIDPGLVPAAPVGAPDGDEGAAGHTIQIGDEDLPEIRYLDEELGSPSPGDGPVVIDDDDTADAVVASEATGRGVDGRMRQRRIRVRRAEGRRRLQWLLIGAGVLVAAIAVLAVLASSLFSVNQITVVGNRYTDPDALKGVIVGLDGTPVLLVDSTAVEEELEAIPWVEDARVRTSFPNSASIEIRERMAVAAMPGADGLTRVLDKEGRVLDLIEGQPIALVWISGPITLDIPAGHFAAPGPTGASALVPKFTPSIRPRVESMQVTPDGSDLRLYLRPLSPAGQPGESDQPAEEGGVPVEQPALLEGPLIEVRFGSAIGDNEQIEKLVRLERVLEDIGTKRVSVIDVSTAEVTVL